MAARHEEGCCVNNIFIVHFHVCRRLPNDNVGVATGIVFHETRPGAGFKTGYFAKEKLGGATVVRLI